MCPEGYYVNGIIVQFQWNCGHGCDNTALNGLQIRCQKPFTKLFETRIVGSGFWGEWQRWIIAD